MGLTTAAKAARIIPDRLKTQPLFLSIDDTMVEKAGTKFELCSKLFGHAAHNGSNYLNGHCIVSLLLSFPVLENEKVRYASVSLGYRLWDKKKRNWQLLRKWYVRLCLSLALTSMYSCCVTGWYPKAEVSGLVDEFENLDIICNVRIDTAMYDLPPVPTGKRGRPKKHREKVSPGQFPFSYPETGKSVSVRY